MNVKLWMVLFWGLSVGYGLNVQAQESDKYTLWPDGAKESNGLKGEEVVDDNGVVRNISVAELTVFRPDKEKNTGMAVVICPGGGYTSLVLEREGNMFARWLAGRGVTGIVLKYRLPNHHHAVPLADAQRAIRFVRTRAEEWGVDPAKIGIAGFSAGGHLASTVGTHFDKGNSNSKDRLEQLSSRPDFMILVYPVISLSSALARQGVREALIGKNGGEGLAGLYSNELHVNRNTPPAFLVHCDDDAVVSSLNSVVFYQQLKKNNIPAVLYIFDKGGHGWGLLPDFQYYQQWTGLLEIWLKQINNKNK